MHQSLDLRGERVYILAMRTLAISNQKGGTGKTATAHALGVLLAASGYKTLLVDIDPQASLTQSAGVSGDGRSLAEVIGGAQPGRLGMGDIIRDLGDNLSLAPGDIALAGAELGLTSRLGRENVLRRLLQSTPGFDVCVIDCPPSLGLLTIGALVAADGVLVPTQPESVALRGLRLFLETIDQVRAELNQELELVGILPTFYDNRLNHHKEAVEIMQRAGLPVMGVKIGRSVRVAEAAGAGESVVTWSPSNPQSENYRQLAEEVIAWLKKAV
jgi:chromosome partitioning protein